MDLPVETHSLLLDGWMTFGLDYPPRRPRPPSHVRMRCHLANTPARSGQHAALAGGVDGLGARRRVELAEQVARVGLGRRLADAQAPVDLLEAQPLLEALEQLALARSERGALGPRS